MRACLDGLPRPPRYSRDVAVSPATTLDTERLRADFAVFDELVNGRPVAYLDSASSTQKPRQVLDAMREFYEHSYANVHRGVYTLAERATEGYEGAREKVRAYINAPSNREIIFTRSATEALNLIAYSWGLENLGPGDVVVITELEHHANFVPWQYIASKTGAQFAHIPIDDYGELQLDALDEIATRGNIKVVANNLVSNTLGTINPVEKLAVWAHDQGAIMVVDAAQAAPHRHIDVQALGCDFLAFSSHKVCGPSGVGALWGRRELLDAMQPFNFGGEMIRSVSLERTSWNELPYKFEAGTPAIAEAYGFGVALDYVSEIGLDAIEAHEHDLIGHAMASLAEIPGLRMFGPPADRRTGIVSFEVANVHPHDVAQILNWEGIAVRAGHHCTQPLMTRLGVAATTRASFYLYSTHEEIDRLVAGLLKVKETFSV
jgi:cysteine desulfurase / selenocysteine lyase